MAEVNEQIFQSVFRDVKPTDFGNNSSINFNEGLHRFVLGDLIITSHYDEHDNYKYSHIHNANGEFIAAFSDFVHTLMFAMADLMKPSI